MAEKDVKAPVALKAPVEGGEKVHDPMDVGPKGKVYRIDHGSLKVRPSLEKRPEYIEAGQLVRLDPEWVKKADPIGNRFISPSESWVHPDKRRDPVAERLVKENEELKQMLAAAEKKAKSLEG